MKQQNTKANRLLFSYHQNLFYYYDDERLFVCLFLHEDIQNHIIPNQEVQSFMCLKVLVKCISYNYKCEMATDKPKAK